MYVRLSQICRSLNKMEQSTNWLLKAKLCKHEIEFDVLLSEVQIASDANDKAKTILETAYVEV